MKSVGVFLLVALFGVANSQPILGDLLKEIIENPDYKPKTIIGEWIQGVSQGIEAEFERLQEDEEEREEQDQTEIENTESSIIEDEQNPQEMRSALEEEKQAVESKRAEAKKPVSGWIESDNEDDFKHIVNELVEAKTEKTKLSFCIESENFL